jgi:hypothetical protein
MSLRKLVLGCGVAALAAAFTIGSARADAPPAKETAKVAPAVKPRVEVVFCLDTTGSMGGLIDAAKKKIWAITNAISTGKPSPDIKIGLVAFRDRGDSFITKVFDLTNDLDAMYANLMSFNADEGGDEPESVNQALFDAVHKIAWSKDKKVLKMIFLVGDAPPHMDYPDDVKYPETCKEAVKRDIIINTVLCGNSESAKEHWLKICRMAEGSFVQIDAGGGPVVAIATPFDKELSEINLKLCDSTLCYGGAEKRGKDGELAKAGGKLKGGDAADRIATLSRDDKGAGAAAFDLLRNINEGKVKLEEIKKDELPELLRGKTLAEQKTILEKVGKERDELSKRAIDLDKKRGEFITKKLAEDEKGRARDSFDSNVLRILRTQAARSGIDYAITEEKGKK